MSKRHAAFLVYLLSIVGWLYVLLFHREDEFAVYPAKQSVLGGWEEGVLTRSRVA